MFSFRSLSVSSSGYFIWLCQVISGTSRAAGDAHSLCCIHTTVDIPVVTIPASLAPDPSGTSVGNIPTSLRRDCPGSRLGITPGKRIPWDAEYHPRKSSSSPSSSSSSISSKSAAAFALPLSFSPLLTNCTFPSPTATPLLPLALKG